MEQHCQASSGPTLETPGGWNWELWARKLVCACACLLSSAQVRIDPFSTFYGSTVYQSQRPSVCVCAVRASTSGDQLCDGIVIPCVSLVAGYCGFFFVLQCFRLHRPEGVGVGCHGDMVADFSLACTSKKGIKAVMDFLFSFSFSPSLSLSGAVSRACHMMSTVLLYLNKTDILKCLVA